MIYCVALTGNVASGKSTAMGYFKKFGIPVLSADEVARTLTLPNTPAFNQIKDHFDDDIITPTGELNRSRLRKKLIYHPEERRWLEALLHPLIREAIEAWVTALPPLHAYCVVEIPLLTDCEEYPYISRVLVLMANKEEQIFRLMERDHCDIEEAGFLLALQPDERMRRALADDLILNNATEAELLSEIKKLHKKYLQEAAQGS